VVDVNSVVNRDSIKLVDESLVVVQNTGLKLKEVDEKTVVYQRVFSRIDSYQSAQFHIVAYTKCKYRRVPKYLSY
jgi:hypothetical protein